MPETTQAHSPPPFISLSYCFILLVDQENIILLDAFIHSKTFISERGSEMLELRYCAEATSETHAPTQSKQ